MSHAETYVWSSYFWNILQEYILKIEKQVSNKMEVYHNLGINSNKHYARWIIVFFNPNPPQSNKPNKGKWRKCSKSDYITEGGLIWAATPKWHAIGGECTVVQELPPQFKSRGPLLFQGDSLEIKMGQGGQGQCPESFLTI